ncbi:hypothetical protein BDA99DRAFT_526299 [Phascolomyces articulosus]|uniref:Uncharacterized protein n=1 Tax=Phascolomyces articulosus TaxID=60185 RepID=A0AAD5P885_9FUNG|nr:hypothetical protein BDA99DRAFT_526299 [Phascolomyces articulosus]
MSPAILELTTMSISKGFNPYDIHSNNNRPDNITITSATTTLTDNPLDPTDNPIYELARVMFLNSSEQDLDYDAFLERKTKELTKIRDEKGNTDASKLLSKHWKFHQTIPDLIATQSTLESTQPLSTQELDWNEDELENSFPPTVIASQPLQQQQKDEEQGSSILLHHDKSHKRKKDKEKDKKKKKKKLTPGFM